MAPEPAAPSADTAADRLLATFLDLVRIDSPSGREGAVAAYCESALASLGATVNRDASASETGSETGNLIVTLPGNASGPVLVLSAHMDCVQPCEGVRPLVRAGVVTSSGDTVLGGDDKAGVAAILEALRRVTANDRPRPDIRVILTVAEERGLVGAKALDRSLLTGDLCLVLDADGEPGGIVVASPTHYTFAATFRGRAAHAGVQPEEGTSAIAMAARAVCAMGLGRLDAETTANIGTIVGGSATNVVAAEAVVSGECRSRDRDRVEVVRAAMEAAMRGAAAQAGGSVDIAWKLEYEGVRFEPDDPDLGLILRACERAGIAPRPFETGGGSDGNVFAAAGLRTMVLSCGMTAVHSTDESVRVADLRDMTALLEAVIAEAVS